MANTTANKRQNLMAYYASLFRGAAIALFIGIAAYMAATYQPPVPLIAGIATGVLLLIYISLDVYLFNSVTSSFTAIGLVTLAGTFVFLANLTGSGMWTRTIAALVPTISFVGPAVVGYMISVRFSPHLSNGVRPK